jgi:hypothetical protein
LFPSVTDAYRSIGVEPAPEFFSAPELLAGDNSQFLLPPWAGTPLTFVY